MLNFLLLGVSLPVPLPTNKSGCHTSNIESLAQNHTDSEEKEGKKKGRKKEEKRKNFVNLDENVPSICYHHGNGKCQLQLGLLSQLSNLK